MTHSQIESYRFGVQNKSYNAECTDFNSVLRITSGQESEPDVVLVEHSYSRPWNWQPGLSCSRPRKTLFLQRPDRFSHLTSDEPIEVESEESLSMLRPYDINKAKSLMNECERNAAIICNALHPENKSETDPNSDDEKEIDRSNWTEAQGNFYDEIIKILDSYQLAKLSLAGTYNEPVKRRAMLDKAVSQFRLLYYNIQWNQSLTCWIHNYAIENFDKDYLASYLDIIQTLKAKAPGLVEKIIGRTRITHKTSVESLKLLLRRPWDPVSNSLSQNKPSKLEKMPLIILIPSGAVSGVTQVSRRTRFFNSQLQHLAKTLTFSVQPDGMNPGAILERILVEAKTRIIETKNQYPTQPIVLLGWGIGAVLAGLVSLVEKVAANVFLGLPMISHAGNLGESDDPLLENKTPSLFLSGGNASNASVEDLEEYRHRMKAITNLVVIADADERLILSQTKKYVENLTQSMVDKCIVDEIGDFLTGILSDDKADSQNTENYVRPKSKETKKKRDSSGSSKIFRAGTNISQNLGLKIPISAAQKKIKSDKDTEETHRKGRSQILNELLSKPKHDITEIKLNSPAGSTINLGSIGSLSNQKYKRMMQLSDQVTEQASVDANQEQKKTVLIKPGSRRGRPPGKGTRVRKNTPGSNRVGRPSNRSKKEEERSMAVLTFTRNGSEIQSSSDCIAPIGRGLFSLTKGGASTVSVYSAESSSSQTNVVPMQIDELVTDSDGCPIINVDSLTQLTPVNQYDNEFTFPMPSSSSGISSNQSNSNVTILDNSTSQPDILPMDTNGEDDGPIMVPAPLSFFDVPKKEPASIIPSTSVASTSSEIPGNSTQLRLQLHNKSSPKKTVIVSKQQPEKGIQILGHIVSPNRTVPSSSIRVVQGVVKKNTNQNPIKITHISKPANIVTKTFKFTSPSKDKSLGSQSSQEKPPSDTLETTLMEAATVLNSGSEASTSESYSVKDHNVRVSFSSVEGSKFVEPKSRKSKDDGIVTRSKDEFKYIGSTRKGSKFRNSM